MRIMMVLTLVVAILAHRRPNCTTDTNLFAKGTYLGWTVAGNVDSKEARAIVEQGTNADSIFQSYDRLPLSTDLPPKRPKRSFL